MSTGRNAAIQEMIKKIKASFEGTEWDITDQEINKEASDLLSLGLDLRELKHSFIGEIKKTYDDLLVHEEKSKIDLAATFVVIARLSNLKKTRLSKFNTVKDAIEKDLKSAEVQHQKLCDEAEIEKKLNNEFIARRKLCTTHIIELAKEYGFLYETSLKQKHQNFTYKYLDLLSNRNAEYEKLQQFDLSMNAISEACQLKIKAGLSGEERAPQRVITGGSTSSAMSTPSSSLIPGTAYPLRTNCSSTTTIISTLPTPLSSSATSTISSNIAPPTAKPPSLSQFFNEDTSPKHDEKHRNSDSTTDFIVPKKNKDNEQQTPRRKRPCYIC